MPLSSLASLNTLLTQARAFVRVAFPTRGTNDAQFLGKQARVMGMALFGVQRTLEAIDRDSPPNPKSSTLGLDTWAFTYGLPSNKGGYGRNGATKGSGGQAPVTGTNGTNVAGLTQLTAPDGVTILQLDTGGMIPFTGSFSAVTPGPAGNLVAGTVLTWINPPAGCDPTVTLSSSIGGALDVENNSQLLTRNLNRIQLPPKGGADVDYKFWAENGALTGVTVFLAFVYPRRQGTGTVDVVITAAGSGAARIPSAGVQAAVLAAIQAIEPTNVEAIHVLVPYAPAANFLKIRTRAQLTSKYSWDWVDNGTPILLASYNAGTPSVTLQAAAPASLQNQIAAGLQPRIQVVSTGANAPVIPDQRRVTAIDGTKTILTIDSVLSSAPNNGDSVYAGSYAAPLIASGMLGFVDGIGPSRASGFAATDLLWNDVVSIFGLSEGAGEVTDTDGVTPLVQNLLAGTTTIAVGSGAPAVQDFEPPDDGINAPQIAVATQVLVTQ